ncbi:helix-turn-helix domain-containing protein [Weissella hellenica]|nr:helix-turn-helix domain-containing protein [Weissella hellenica]
MTTFERIKQTAKERGLTLNQLNDAAKLKNNIIYSWKNKMPSAENLSKVADVLGVSVDYLLGNTDDMHANKKADTSSDDLKEYFDEHPVLKFDGKEIPEAEMKIIKRILEDMDD